MKKNILIVLVLLIICGCAKREVLYSSRLNHVIFGMTKAEVINVMGEPHSTAAQGQMVYLNYLLHDVHFRSRFYVRLIKGKVESWGRTGDFDSTQKPTIKIKTEENIKINQ